MEFNNLKELEAFLQNKINDSLTDNVARQVKDEIALAVDRTIYDSGVPTTYERRGIALQNGGLADQTQMEDVLESNGVLVVTDNAQPKVTGEYNGLDNDKSLTENIVRGYGSKDKWWNEPRDFIQSAKDEMQETKSHVQALVNGLIERGIDVDGKSFK